MQMMEMEFGSRGTGRTTRMLYHAFLHGVLEGRRLVIIGVTQEAAAELVAELISMAKGQGLEVEHIADATYRLGGVAVTPVGFAAAERIAAAEEAGPALWIADHAAAERALEDHVMSILRRAQDS